jgi:hypothetical protein
MLIQAHSPNQLIEARIGTDGIELWLHDHPGDVAGARLRLPREQTIHIA